MKSLENISNQSNQNCTFLPEPPITNNNPLDPASILNYLNTKQAAEYLQVSTQWLEIGRVKGYGPPFIKLSRLVRYKRTDLDEWMSNHRQKNTLGDKGGVGK